MTRSKYIVRSKVLYIYHIELHLSPGRTYRCFLSLNRPIFTHIKPIASSIGGGKMSTVLAGNLLEETIPVCFREGDYVVKSITDKDEMLEVFRLRHRVFCEELAWVPSTPWVLEIDAYDNHAIPFGVFDSRNNLVAYLRLVMPTHEFMMEKEFRKMVDPTHNIRKEPDTAEISRLCIAPEARKDQVVTDFGKHTISVVLLKGIYRWCKLNGIRYLYAITDDKVYRIARARGFTFNLIGEPTSMPDGVTVVAMVLDWEEFEDNTTIKRPKMSVWFSQYISVPDQMLSLQHAPL